MNTHLAYDLDMETRLRDVPALPELRRDIDVVRASGALEVVTVPSVHPAVTLATTEVILSIACIILHIFLNLLLVDVHLLFRFLLSGQRRRTS